MIENPKDLLILVVVVVLGALAAAWAAPAEVEAAAVVLQLAVLLVAAWFARGQLQEARDAREDQSRPHVVVDFARRGDFVYLLVKNYGKTLARNIRFNFDPPLTSAHSEVTGSVAASKYLRDGLPGLAPDRELRVVFEHFPTRKESGADFPTAFSARVEYGGERNKVYEPDTYTLDLGVHMDSHWITQHEYDNEHIVRRLSDIVSLLKDFGTGPGHGRGVLIRTTAELRRQDDDLVRRAQGTSGTGDEETA